MFNAKGFFDYGVSIKSVENGEYETTVKLLYDYGYRTIAINQEVLETEPQAGAKNKKKKKGDTRFENVDLVPEPFEIKPVDGCEEMKILNRLTIEFSHQDQLHKITKSPLYKKYHIVAALPTTNSAVLFTSSSFEGDIFCFNPLNKSAIRPNRKMFNQLIERGFHFELPYGPVIEDQTQRKNVIHIAHIYHSYAKSRNVIVSSLASNRILLRSPYDIINLGLLFGLNEQHAKNAISHCGRQVFINSVGRRHGKAVMFVENIPEEEKRVEMIPVPEEDSVILLDSEEEIMEVDQPAQKKIKQ